MSTFIAIAAARADRFAATVVPGACDGCPPVRRVVARAPVETFAVGVVPPGTHDLASLGFPVGGRACALPPVGDHQVWVTTWLPPRIEPELLERCSTFATGALRCRVEPAPTADVFAVELAAAVADAAAEPLDSIADHPVIAATRELYRRCGKDPSRYRPAAEQLRRRAVRGAGPFPVHPLVDIVNWLSLRTGFSISSADATALRGPIRWGIGRAGEPYEAIGRGPLNIAGLPVVRDDLGPFASPTSDSVRARIRDETRELLIILCAPGGPEGLVGALEMARVALTTVLAARDIETHIVHPAGGV